MTVGQFSRCIDGYKDLVERQTKQQDRLNHVLGNYIATGINNPKKYPKQPLLSEDESKKTTYTSDTAHERMAQIKYGKKK